AQRQHNLRRVIHNFQLLSTGLSQRDAALSSWVVSSNAVFAHLANQDTNIQSTLQLLPPTLVQTNAAPAKTGQLANVLGPSLPAHATRASCSTPPGPTISALRCSRSRMPTGRSATASWRSPAPPPRCSSR